MDRFGDRKIILSIQSNESYIRIVLSEFEIQYSAYEKQRRMNGRKSGKVLELVLSE